MRSILSRIFGLPATTTRQGPPKKIKPRVEALESRWCPATTASISNGVVTINGDDKVNEVVVRDLGGGTVSLILNGRGQAFINVDRIEVRTKGGQDVVKFEQVIDRTRGLALTVDLGGDADRFQGFVFTKILSGHGLEMRVNGGGGRDFFQVLSGGDVQASAALWIDLNGGDDRDRVEANYAGGKLDGELRVNVRGGNGDDNLVRDAVSVVVAVAAGSQGQLGSAAARATAEGNAGNDDLTFVLRHADSPAFRAFATIDGGRGPFLGFLRRERDVGRHTANVSASNLESDIIVT